MKSVTGSSARKLGRPLSFDRDAALEKAMLLFWRQGYEATSLSELTTAMGISPPSLYAVFGDKKRLFLTAVERYVTMSESPPDLIRKAPTAREAVSNLLRASVVGHTQKGKPPGCFLVSGAANCSAASQDVQDEMARMRGKVERALRDKIRIAIEEGELPADTDAATLAAFYMSVTQGMSAQAQDGAKRVRLLGIADAAMRAWPAKTGKTS